MKIAALFPGQGSHAVGMGTDIAAEHEIAEDVYAAKDEALPGLRHLVEAGPFDELTMTANQQPALVAASIAAYAAWFDARKIRPAFAAGHSLGEYSALVASGALGLADALRLTRKRGELMQSAVPAGLGAMSAVMGDPLVVAEVCAQVSASTGGVVQPANYNAPTQTVISGSKDAVDTANAELKARGLKAIPLKVSAPFHCPLMQPAQEGLTPDLRATDFLDPTIPVYANVTAQPHLSAQDWPDLLSRQIIGSVRWVETIQALAEAGATVFIEFGPGTVLTGLVRRILPSAKTLNVGTAEQISNFEQQLWEVSEK